MYNDVDFIFTTSLSSSSYLTKEEATTALIQSDSTPAMAWVTRQVTMDEMLNSCITGHSYCNLFNNLNGEVYSRPFHSWDKTNDNFSGSYVVTVDVDEFGESAEKYDLQITNYIHELTQHNLAPSLWYTSFSHQPSEHKLKAHLLYVFDSLIPGRDGGETYRILSEAICQRISDAGGVPIDKCSTTCSQYINPTNIDNSSLCVEYGISHAVYSFEDFSLSNLHEIWEGNVMAYVPKSRRMTVSKSLINDYKLMTEDDFLAKYGAQYHYFYRMEEYEWNTTSTGCQYAEIDEDYFALYFNVNTLTDGHGRRKKIFERMCERRLMRPEATPNQIAYCAVKDVALFVDNGDKVFDAEYFMRNVNHCFELSLEEIMQKYSHNISYLKSKAPKRKIIYKYALGMDLSQKAKARRDVFAEMVFKVYDVALSPEENSRILASEHNITIAPSTLYNYFRDYNVDYTVYKSSRQSEKDNVVQTTLNDMSEQGIKITCRSLKQLLKDKGVKMSNKTLSDYVRGYKSMNH